MPAAGLERQIERYLHEYFPLSAAMGVRVESATVERVQLSAPLAPNVNHNETVFGGSAAALATLAAWTLLHLRLEQAGCDARLVIQRSSMEYERPAWGRFRATLERRARARLTLTAYLAREGHRVASFEGDFVAFRRTAAE